MPLLLLVVKAATVAVFGQKAFEVGAQDLLWCALTTTIWGVTRRPTNNALWAILLLGSLAFAFFVLMEGQQMALLLRWLLRFAGALVCFMWVWAVQSEAR
jgi:hypothetical protein